MGTVGTTVIKGTFYWPFLGKQNDMKGRYTLDIGQLNKEAKKQLKALGVHAKVKKDRPRDGYKADGDKFVSSDPDKRDRLNRGEFITVQSMYPPRVVSNRNEPIDPNTIGEGSIGQVRVQAFTWSFQNKEGDKDEGTLGAGFNKVVVNSLVSFGSPDDDDSDFEFEESDEDEFDDDDDLDDEFEAA
jgi:hypothetical protein